MRNMLHKPVQVRVWGSHDKVNSIVRQTPGCAGSTDGVATLGLTVRRGRYTHFVAGSGQGTGSHFGKVPDVVRNIHVSPVLVSILSAP